MKAPIYILMVVLFTRVAFAATPPNILFLVADDLRADALGCAGNKIIQTPNIDNLAKRGTMFRNAFVTTSICCVSRASLFSGQYARRHGIADFKTSFTGAQWSNTYTMLLRSHGYRTGFIGKFGVGDAMPTNSFDYWDGFPGQGRYFRSNDPVHLTHKMGESGLKFLRTRDNRPFCLSISFKSPHAQDESAARPFPPDLADEALYRGMKLPTAKNYSSEAFARLPEFAQESEGHTRFLRRFADPDSRQRNVADYYRLVSGMDREIGRLVAALRELGLEDNTLVVFTSDNGFFLGERGLSDKFLMYEESIRVPLIVFDPRTPASARGHRADEMVLNIDLAPTLLEAAGLRVPSEVQGKSLLSLVRGQKTEWRDDWFYEHHFAYGGKIPESEGVRTGQWKYIRYTSAAPAVEELYDLRKDPLETRNLAGVSEYADQLADLRLRWLRFRDDLR